MTVRIVQDAEPLPGYRLIERLGRGGYGEVWKAEAPGGLFKAIKFVYGDLEGAGDDNRAAEQELKALNRVKTIRHPYILSIERFDIIEGQLMIVMELADRNLWDRFQECRSQGLPGLPRDEVLRYMDESAEALDLMNSHYQIQHLDIKPQNLFLVHNHVKVADFGLAKDFEGIRATVTGGVTPVYAAPETFEGWISRFCDQYSLAIVYQELLTGVRPFAGTNTRQLLMQHLSATPDVSALPPQEREIIARALSKKPDERYPTCTDFVKAIRESALAPVAKPAPETPRAEGKADPTRTVPNFRPAKSADTSPVQPLITPANAQPANRPSALRGLPPLVTPGPVVSSSSVAPAASANAAPSPVTLQRPIAFETGRISRLGIAPIEKTGTGVLFPVYVVGAGKLGLHAMQRLRAFLNERSGRTSFPHWKWLFVDTDPETIQAATTGPRSEVFDQGEIYFARMHRPAHYLKREGLPSPDTWMSNELLYRMPREPMTGGLRCLGRLALCDHYLNLAQKIRQDLETFMSEDVLLEADRQTNLGIRTNRPRVYLASSLCGGSGSGMLLDLAYIIRNEMRQMGFAKQLITGLFFTPPVDRSSPKSLPIANTCAALAEIHHFSSPSTRYEARFDLRQPSIADPERPFDRTVLLNLPRTPATKLPPAVERAAGLIYQEALTPLGRSMDDARAAFQLKQPLPTMPVQSFGFFRFTWPRQRMLDAAAERFAARTIQHWCAKDMASIREIIANWFEEQWAKRQLDPSSIASALEAAMATTLGEQPAVLIEAELRRMLGEPGAGKVEPKEVLACFERFFELVGKAGKDEEFLPGRLMCILEGVSRPITKESEIKFAKMAVHFIEQPAYRLAGAEETIRLCTERLRTLIDEQERKSQQLAHELDEEFIKLMPLLESISHGAHVKQSRKSPSEILNPFRVWAAKRLNHLLYRCVGAIYRQMLGNAPEYVREVSYCRQQLTEMATQLKKSSEIVSERLSSQDHPILPPGSRTLIDAADRFIASLSETALHEFEEGLQQQIRRHCRAVVSVCLAMSESGPRFKEILVEQCRLFIDSRLGQHTPAEEFFRNRPDPQSVHREILRAYDECAPEPFGPIPRPEAQSFLLGITSDEYGARFKEIAQDLLPEIQLINAPSANEIVFYREFHDVPITDVPQASVLAVEAVREVRSRDRINAHSRTDIRWDSFLRDSDSSRG